MAVEVSLSESDLSSGKSGDILDFFRNFIVLSTGNAAHTTLHMSIFFMEKYYAQWIERVKKTFKKVPC